MNKLQQLPAGNFSSWLRCMRQALLTETGIDVPCGECNACCRSSFFITIKPDETRTLNRIPTEILFAAPGLPMGNKIMGYDEHGRCPLLIDNTCSIYEHRPLTCRTFDCRIFSAAGISANDNDNALINQQIRRWEFHYSTKRDRDQHTAVQAAARFLRKRANCFPNGNVPTNPIQLAILAIKVYDVFLDYNYESDKNSEGPADHEIAKAIMEVNEKFELRRDKIKTHPA